MQRRSFLKQIAIASSLSFFIRPRSAAAADSAARSNAGLHKFLSCNVRVDLKEDNDSGDGWKDRRELCADVIRGQKADLIGLQEAQEQHLSYLQSRMPEYDSFGLSRSATIYQPANAILFLRDRYELISAGGFWLSETPHVVESRSWDSAGPRLANFVDLRDRSTGKRFRFWNTHLDHKGQKAREKGALMVVQAAAALPKDLPQLLSGDMNAKRDNQAIKNFKDGGWVDTYEQIHGLKDPGFTFHGFKGEKYSPALNSDGNRGSRIDWIFCRGAVKPTSAGIIRDSKNGRWPSDHYFISTEVII